MTASISTPIRKQKRGTFSKKFNWNYFLQDNLTGSRGLMIWVGLITLVTLGLTISQLQAAPGRATIILVVWIVGVLSVVIGELFTLHTPISRWLKENMFNTVTNTFISLLLAMLVGMIVAGIWNWGFTNATFSESLTAPEVRGDGASWGVLSGARKLLLTGLLDPIHTWRVVLTTVMILVLWLATFIAGRPALEEQTARVRPVINFLWLLSPVLSFIFLAGIEYDSTQPLLNAGALIRGLVIVLALMGILWFFKVIQLTPPAIAGWVFAWPVAYIAWRLIAMSEVFPPINVDDWGGLLLTVIFAIFVNILSFPIGILLALGRRADVQGIPWWITWPVAIFGTIWFLATSTGGADGLWATSRNWIEQTLALWPLLIIIAAYYFDRVFDGNLVQAFSILFIELVRGVPLITLLFMAIVMSPFFSAEGTGVKNFWAVIVGYTIFSSAYMAELVRGGLQAIPRGQYEAADSLGFNTLQKYRFIVLPQALRILIPPLAGAVIGTFKSSSLVALVGMIDLVGVVRAIIANPKWLGLRTELYVFMFVLYFVVSSVVSWYSRRLEERTGLGVR